jgi:hypothetical protein
VASRSWSRLASLRWMAVEMWSWPACSRPRATRLTSPRAALAKKAIQSAHTRPELDNQYVARGLSALGQQFCNEILDRGLDGFLAVETLDEIESVTDRRDVANPEQRADVVLIALHPARHQLHRQQIPW